MPFRRDTLSKPRMAATLAGVAAICACLSAIFWAGPLRAEAPSGEAARLAATELRVALGDVRRLAGGELPPAHAAGLADRINGALGLLPWLLRQSGDPEGAEALEGRDASDPMLGDTLATLAARHPLDLAARLDLAVPGPLRAEAAAIDEAYCFGCHDGAGEGDPFEPLPIRDLGQMAASEPAEIFLARLISGVRGEASIAFRNPLTDRQILALFAHYRAAATAPAD